MADQSKTERAAVSVASMILEWLKLDIGAAREQTLAELITMRLERFFPTVEDSCGCVFCDIDLEPFEAEGFKWHKTNGNDPVRCTKI